MRGLDPQLMSDEPPEEWWALAQRPVLTVCRPPLLPGEHLLRGPRPREDRFSPNGSALPLAGLGPSQAPWASPGVCRANTFWKCRAPGHPSDASPSLSNSCGFRPFSQKRPRLGFLTPGSHVQPPPAQAARLRGSPPTLACFLAWLGLEQALPLTENSRSARSFCAVRVLSRALAGAEAAGKDTGKITRETERTFGPLRCLSKSLLVTGFT